MALYRSPLTATLWPSSFLKKYGPMIPPAHKAHQTFYTSKKHPLLGDFNAKNTTWGSIITNARGLELNNLVNDKVFLCLNNGTHTFLINSYGSTDVLDLTFTSPGLFPYSSWRVLDNIGSDDLPF
ncbi:RNA-directed DNA polymerase from mobile element jockey [Trichonephila clavipes]|nr:RNA-directed DNA polymerase from mobile element jockey [Trichonephila clavipes]